MDVPVQDCVVPPGQVSPSSAFLQTVVHPLQGVGGTMTSIGSSANAVCPIMAILIARRTVATVQRTEESILKPLDIVSPFRNRG